MVREDQHAQGILEIHPKGYGFLRNPARNYVAQPADPYVPGPVIHQFHLHAGTMIAGPVEDGRRGSGPRLLRLEKIEGDAPEKYNRRKFDDLTPVDPHEQIV